MEDKEMEEGQMEDKDISRRDFVRKALQYTAAGAVLGSMAGIGGINTPDAEGSDGDFIAFMKAAQSNPELANTFVNMVNSLCGGAKEGSTAAYELQKWLNANHCSVSILEAQTILDICCAMTPEHERTYHRLVQKTYPVTSQAY